MKEPLKLVVITGMSGAGKTVAVQSFEDLGYFCIDNMPPSLLPKFWELVRESGKINKVALVIDLRSRAFYDEIIELLRNLGSDNAIDTKILFLDASDEELVARYKETRRSHPLAMEGRLMDGINLERDLLRDMRMKAQLVVDTSKLTPRQLREEIFHNFETSSETAFHIEIMSFGFKYGVPIDADIVMDVRFLPNPYYIDALKKKTGLDKDVYDYVMSSDKTEVFYTQFITLLHTIIPGYKDEGKTSLTVAIGCTGGQHRSVALSKRIGEELEKSYPVRISHRDIARRKETVNRS
ncbi:RNase adapter RapZ [Liquorilactobacillus mali]|uniref:GlmZ(SRNA)-inactivating NTPase n=1 Tax=Liquorilactobacillus mali KCTC 3596 = DSM 20444 TaxID=1046596 RepID=J0L6A9_9LACO|nr:RNase adapter RapZ [Liquorilactobacillus mali]EJF00210.1 glmZ(sRNA)-inactivating NTPase [Liquorilactobacillus mali KCTC 3596 = DSM 20444]KRN09605.1 glmZ(sRNA)-inactivating NTPase [Liquorilactobacillus mali KCTC 3596 = DSM 20444]MDC7953235.1 RNase adapter RapZ [Liquorilactobacillus mali]MDV7756721.1 RNase adapter RapZ [Liquorilactobacillus mali]QFQ74211.1 RNase adapter RapZ [Liquorilactobacillus mali]